MLFTVYVIRNEINDIYIGYTDDLVKRLKRHNGELPTAKKSFTHKRKNGEWKIIHTEEFETRQQAVKREKQLKSYRGREFVRNTVAQLVDPPAGGLLS